MRFRVILLEHAKADVRSLTPVPKRLVRRALRDMEGDPYALDTIQLERPEILFRVRVDDYRIIFRPGPAVREVTVIRVAHRDRAYEGLERLSSDD